MPHSTASSIVVIFCLLITTALGAGSQYANDDPEDCRIIGDANIYGLGIRLSYYFQFIAALLSPYLAPEQLDKICVAFGASTLASYAAVYENSAKGYFVAIDWYVVSCLTLGLGQSMLWFNPGARDVSFPERITLVQSFIPSWTGGNLRKSFYGPFGWLCLMSGMNLMAGPFTYWKVINIAHKEGCSMHFLYSIGVFSFNVNIYNSKWIIFLKIWSVVLLIPGLFLLGYGAIMLLFAGSTRILRETHDAGNKWTQIGYMGAQAIITFWSIFLVEMTIKNNHVDLSETPITSAGQFIPLLVGCLTLLLVFVHWLRRFCEGVVSVKLFESYFGVLSKGTKMLERIFGGRAKSEEHVDAASGENVELIQGASHI